VYPTGGKIKTGDEVLQRKPCPKAAMSITVPTRNGLRDEMKMSLSGERLAINLHDPQDSQKDFESCNHNSF
jgi:tryptophanyl-tRNA synthetase